MHLDGEVWGGRGQWEATVAAVVRNQWAPSVCFRVFDAPEVPGYRAERIKAASRCVRCTFAAVVPWRPVNDLEHASQMFRTIRLAGGEGMILRHPTAQGYETRGSGTVLKVKRCPIHGDLKWPNAGRSR